MKIQFITLFCYLEYKINSSIRAILAQRLMRKVCVCSIEKRVSEDESKVFQQEIYTYLLKRKSRGQMVINIQDVEETNVAINRNDLDLSKMTSSEICELLEVDGILSSQFGLSKPMSAGAAIALSLFTGMAGSTNEVTVSLSLKDCSTKSLIWKYDHKYSGGILSSPTSLVENLMRDASRKMPYFR